MPVSNKSMIHKLQTAINTHGGLILIDKAQFYSDDQQRPVSVYKICTRNESSKKKHVLFKTSSQIQIVLYLRDYWYWMNGREIPTDNEQWNEVKRVNGVVFSKQEEI